MFASVGKAKCDAIRVNFVGELVTVRVGERVGKRVTVGVAVGVAGRVTERVS